MAGFRNSILSAAGRLVRAAIQSPNFVSGSAGWSVNKDGSAEFNNVTIRGTLTDSKFFIYDPSPGLGNLVKSITDENLAPFNDRYGNPVIPGDTSYKPGVSAVNITGTGGTSFFWWTGSAWVGASQQFLGGVSFQGHGGIFYGPWSAGGHAYVVPSNDPSGATDLNNINGALAASTVEVHLLPGTYTVNGSIAFPGNVPFIGPSGRGPAVIKLAANVNAPILISQNFASLTGSGSNTQGVTGFKISDIVFDGNKANQSAPAAAAVQIFGYDFVIDNVSIRNFLATDGLWTEFGPGGQPGPEGTMDARYSMLRIHGNTLTGAAWRNRGPHDSHIVGAFIYQNTVNASGYQPETSGTYSGSACLVHAMHVWGTHSIAYNLTAETHCVNCVAEGGATGQVLVTGGNSSWADGIVFPAGSSGYGFQLGTLATPCTGFVMDDPTITGFAGTNAGNAAIDVVNTASGKYSALIFQTSGQALWGSFQPYEVRKFSFGGLVTPSVAAAGGLGTGPPAPTLSNASDNRGAVNMGTGTAPAAGSAATVTFAQPKAGTPTISVWPIGAAAAALQPYVSGAGSTGFTIGFAVAPAASQPAGTYVVGYADESG